MPYSLGLPLLVSQQTYHVLRARYDTFINAKNPHCDLIHSIQTGLCFPYNAHEFHQIVSGVENHVGLIVGRLFDLLIGFMKKDQTVKFIYFQEALSFFPCRKFSIFEALFSFVEVFSFLLQSGVILSLCLLSRIYPTTSYARCWFGVIEESDLAMGRYTSPSGTEMISIDEFYVICNI